MCVMFKVESFSFVFLLIRDSNKNHGPMQSQLCAYEGLCVTIFININWTIFLEPARFFEVLAAGRFYEREPVLYLKTSKDPVD